MVGTHRIKIVVKLTGHQNCRIIAPELFYNYQSINTGS